MNSGESIVAMIGVLGVLVLASAGLRGRNIPRARMLSHAATWAALIVGLALALKLAGYG